MLGFLRHHQPTVLCLFLWFIKGSVVPSIDLNRPEKTPIGQSFSSAYALGGQAILLPFGGLIAWLALYLIW